MTDQSGSNAGELVVSDHTDKSRFEAHVDGRLAGYAEYEQSDSVITFTHTIVKDGFEGQGIGGRLVRAALDTVAASEGVRVVAECSFVAAFIDKHPEYQPLLAS
ncbi:MAG TPA: GNAT family N-acetyltransferase [Dermatophilaceae bacterium]|nr:GNAT family N-acetyltransferase [Dermatophilaceae bacterium]